MKEESSRFYCKKPFDDNKKFKILQIINALDFEKPNFKKNKITVKIKSKLIKTKLENFKKILPHDLTAYF